jgi:cobaltochelatase CobN
VLRFVTTADTEILATAAAVRRLPDDFPEVRCANPQGTRDLDPFLDDVLDGARVVVIRVLGGRRGWPGGVDRLAERCRAGGVALIALGGEARPDAEMTALSTVPAGVVAQAGEYLRAGDVDNIEQLLRFLADTLLLHGFGFDEPQAVADLGVYLPGRGDVAIEAALAGREAGAPIVGITFYRAHRITGNTAFVDELCAAVRRAGGHPVAVWAQTLRRSEADGRVPALDLLAGHADALITTMLATGGAQSDDDQAWDAGAIEALDVPVVQALTVTMSRARWDEGGEGLLPVDAATQVAIPEFDGRIIGGPVSFKERDAEDSPVGVPVPRYVPDPERCDRLAQLVVRHARLRTQARRRIAIVLTAFPTKHARIGMAVGLDTPASAIRLLHRLRQDGIDVRDIPADGDALMHALIAAGGHDPDFLTEEILAAAPLRLPVSEYLEWYTSLDPRLTAAMEERWGPPPGDRYVERDDLVIAGLDLGDVVVLIQPPRGYGDDQVGIYHDPELAPAHHYLAAYRWLDRHWGADAIVHLGKHGTLEWLPGKMVALSAACAPDAALGSMPLVYPFVVNDPGEGAQAKRRAHAVVVDHLVPPMRRAESYDELADLEALMDEYARLEVLDPAKLPGLGARIWAAIEQANLQEDLGIDDRPDDAGALVEHLDGYLCEVKDVQIKDGLHILGAAPEGPQLRGLVAAIGRHGIGDVPGLRRSVAAAFGLDEPALVAAPGARAAHGAGRSLLARFPGSAHRASDLIDRLEEAQSALLVALSEHGWDAERAEEICRSVLGRDDGGVVAALRFACDEIVPRLQRTTDELDHVLAALRGHHVPSGPSGAPTRGRLDVLPTGRNFYTVDPRALPTELSYATGVKLADAVLERHVADTGALPEMVGLVAWGTAAMRTQGDDAAEVLALLGVRPTWHPSSRRVTGLEVVPLAELGRPRVDVTLRISGFFRDAFPHLIGLLDDAVTMVAGLDESDDDNFVAKHARAQAERLAGAIDAAEAWRRSTTRIFGSKPGTYGAGLSQLLETQDWRDDRDLAAVYEAWGGFAYGRGLHGVAAPEAMRACFERIDVAVKNVDSREHDHLDSDDYYQYHGGMVATVRALRGGREPAAYLGDSADPERVKVRTLVDETRRVFRARVANPAWIGSMVRHGFKGAAELAATVDYLFGYDATTGATSDWMYEQVAARYLLDDDVAAFMDQANPWAARGIAEKLLEAADRGLWAEPQDETIKAIRARYLALEDALEGAAAS